MYPERSRASGEDSPERRRFIHVLGTLGLLGAAGCMGGDDGESDDEENGDDGTSSEEGVVFEVSDIEPDPVEVNYGRSFDVEATVVNAGDEAGEKDVRLELSGEELDSTSLELEPDESGTASFGEVDTESREPDTYDLAVATDDDEMTGELIVREPTYSTTDFDGEYVEVGGSQGTVARYRYEFSEDEFNPNGLDDVSKTYLSVLDPLTEELLTLEPRNTNVGNDHQRGIFVAWDCLTVDGQQHAFWHMDGRRGTDGAELIRHTGFGDSLDTFRADQTIVSNCEWITGDDSVVLEEERKMTFVEPSVDDGVVQIDFETTLEATDQTVDLDFCHGFDDANDEPYGGVRWRAPASVQEDDAASFHFPEETFPDGDPDVLEIREETGIPWALMSYPLESEQYVVQQMDHPDNEFDTRWSAYRSYGLFGTFFEETIEPGERLTAKFGFSVTRGDRPDDDVCESVYDAYIERA